MRRFLGSMASGTQLGASAMVGLLGARFAMSALAAMLARSAPDSSGAPPVDSSFDQMLSEARAAASAHNQKANDLVPRPPAPTPAAAPSTNERISLNLSISVGPPRSELYVNGKAKGHVPYVGTLVCRTGQPIKIQILPIEGPPIEFERPCAGTLLVVSDVPAAGGASATGGAAPVQP